MDPLTGDPRTTKPTHALSRRAALRGLGGAGVAALALGLPGLAGADDGNRLARALFSSRVAADPASVIDAYVAAVNAGDLEAILALYADDAVHIFLPTLDGSTGICLGKEQFRKWYEQSVAAGDRIDVEPGTLQADGERATFVTRLRSDPWRAMGIETLEANAEAVIVDGQIRNHVVMLTPASVRQLLTASGAIPESIPAQALSPHIMHTPW